MEGMIMGRGFMNSKETDSGMETGMETGRETGMETGREAKEIESRKPAEKLEVLVKLADLLNRHRITWAVGASLLLYFKGIVTDFQDIDILVDEKDADTVRQLLSGLGRLQPPNPSARYETKVFLEYLVDGVEVDLMAGFAIVAEGRSYPCPLAKERISEFVTIRNTKIPLQSLEEWKGYYALMGRTEKVRRIEAYFEAQRRGEAAQAQREGAAHGR